MFFEAFVVNFVNWLQVFQPRLSLFPTLSCIVTCLPMSFYIKSLFNPFLLLHCCCLPLRNLLLLLLLSMIFFLFLMAVVPLIIVARVRRRGDRPLSRKNRNIYSWKKMGRDKEFLSLYVKIWTGVAT